jgi:ribosomal 50S subunit-associated protein YjgA (DUF615 family)
LPPYDDFCNTLLSHAALVAVVIRILRFLCYTVISFGMDDDQNPPEKPSRTAKKNELKAIQALTEKLAGLSPGILNTLKLDPDLRKEIDETKRITVPAARRRRLSYLSTIVGQYYDLESLQKLLKLYIK